MIYFVQIDNESLRNIIYNKDDIFIVLGIFEIYINIYTLQK